MRVTLIALWISLLWSLTATSAVDKEPSAKDHPVETALFQDATGKWEYKSFPDLRRLYVFDKDRPGKSNCNGGCASAWPPLLVREKGDRVGNWTVVIRDDGRKQWAYKGRPVYMRFHDMPEGNASVETEGFRALEP